jgi:hypothetical protein
MGLAVMGMVELTVPAGGNGQQQTKLDRNKNPFRKEGIHM